LKQVRKALEARCAAAEASSADLLREKEAEFAAIEQGGMLIEAENSKLHAELEI